MSYCSAQSFRGSLISPLQPEEVERVVAKRLRKLKEGMESLKNRRAFLSCRDQERRGRVQARRDCDRLLRVKTGELRRALEEDYESGLRQEISNLEKLTPRLLSKGAIEKLKTLARNVVRRNIQAQIQKIKLSDWSTENLVVALRRENLSSRPLATLRASPLTLSGGETRRKREEERGREEGDAGAGEVEKTEPEKEEVGEGKAEGQYGWRSKGRRVSFEKEP